MVVKLINSDNKNVDEIDEENQPLQKNAYEAIAVNFWALVKLLIWLTIMKKRCFSPPLDPMISCEGIISKFTF